MEATFSSASPATVHWQKDGIDLAGRTGKELSIDSVTESDVGFYVAVVSSMEGSVTSSTVSLTVSYSLNASSVENGTVIRDPNQPSYARDSTVTVTALPDPGYVFHSWIGDASGNTNPLSVLMTNNKSIGVQGLD